MKMNGATVQSFVIKSSDIDARCQYQAMKCRWNGDAKLQMQWNNIDYFFRLFVKLYFICIYFRSNGRRALMHCISLVYSLHVESEVFHCIFICHSRTRAHLLGIVNEVTIDSDST